MRPERFDNLSRVVAGHTSRRRVIQLLAAGSVAGLVGVNTLPAHAGSSFGCGVQTVGLWLNAFIPGEVPGLTRVMDVGPYAGLSVVPTPVLPDFLGCFLTDQRSFSDLEGSGCGSHPSSRITAMCTVDVLSQTITSQSMFSCGTTHLDCSSGEVMCSQVAEVNGEGFVVTNASRAGMSLRLRGWGHDPCINAPAELVPDIDFAVHFDLSFEDSGAVRISADGAVEVFPAFEIYAMADNGSAVLLFDHFPDPGMTPGDLAHSQLGVPFRGFGRLDNPNTCESGSPCCGPGCCPSGSTCCPDQASCCNQSAPVCCSQFGGGCCTTEFGQCCPGPDGGAWCCPPSASCCPGAFTWDYCCPSDYYCCDDGCCVKGEVCCVMPGLESRCCPAGYECVDVGRPIIFCHRIGSARPGTPGFRESDLVPARGHASAQSDGRQGAPAAGQPGGSRAQKRHALAPSKRKGK